MPARSSPTFRCHCSSCNSSCNLGPDGRPLGKEFPVSQRNAHLTRVKLEQEANERAHASVIANVASAVFASTLADDGPTPKTQPSKFWTTRHQYQLLPSTPDVQICDPTSSVNAIMSGVQRLDALNPSSVASTGPVTQVTSRCPLSDNFNAPLQKQSKRERNHATKKAHCILDALSKRASACLEHLLHEPSRTHLETAENEVSRLQSALENIKRNTPSVEQKKSSLTPLLSQLDSRIMELKSIYPPKNDQPLQYNSGTCSYVPYFFASDILTDHHFDLPINHYDSVAQLTMFIAIVCNVIMGVSRRMGDMIINLLSILVSWAFRDRQGNLSAKELSTLGQIPLTMATVFSKFNLDGQTTTYAVCPKCHYTSMPTLKPGLSTATYPTHCGNRPNPDSDMCNELLLVTTKDEEDMSCSKPLKPFIYPSFHDYIARLLSRSDLENHMDSTCDVLMDSIRQKHQPPKFVTDISQAEFLRTFKGPDGEHLFFDRPDNEGRYVFSLNVDFFNSEGMSVRGPSVSSGIISAACLNLPLDIRYKPENMYVCIIPGPKEPHLTELNHYLRPLIDDLSVSWERSVFFSRTANYPKGRHTRCGIACAVCDLPAARKLSQSANHNSHFYCTVCNCFHTKTLGRTDFESPDWMRKDVTALRKAAEEWKNASTAREQVNLFQRNGVRWSEMWRLPYWDPTRMLVVDLMHCLLEGLAQFHFREVLKLTSANANAKEMPAPAFTFPFSPPTSADIPEGMTDNEKKQIEEIHALLQATVIGGEDSMIIEANVKLLTGKLERKNMKPLMYVTKGLGVDPKGPGRISKLRRAEALTEWVSSSIFSRIELYSYLHSECNTL
jgi:hypothetical protein